jgi:hypothetical protein
MSVIVRTIAAAISDFKGAVAETVGVCTSGEWRRGRTLSPTRSTK